MTGCLSWIGDVVTPPDQDMDRTPHDRGLTDRGRRRTAWFQVNDAERGRLASRKSLGVPCGGRRCVESFAWSGRRTGGDTEAVASGRASFGATGHGPASMGHPPGVTVAVVCAD